MSEGSATGLVPRMLGAARWDGATYEAIKSDDGAMKQAAIVVAIYLLAFSIGTGALTVSALFSNAVAIYASWVVLAFFVGWIGVKFFGGQGSTSELMRTMGFGYSAGVLMLVGLLPFIGLVIRTPVALLIGFTVLFAVKKTLGIGWVKAFLAVLLAAVPWFFVMFGLLMVLPG